MKGKNKNAQLLFPDTSNVPMYEDFSPFEDALGKWNWLDQKLVIQFSTILAVKSDWDWLVQLAWWLGIFVNIATAHETQLTEYLPFRFWAWRECSLFGQVLSLMLSQK